MSRTSKIPVGERVLLYNDGSVYAVDVVQVKTFFEGEPGEFSLYQIVDEIRCDRDFNRHRSQLYREDELAELRDDIRQARYMAEEYLSILADHFSDRHYQPLTTNLLSFPHGNLWR